MITNLLKDFSGVLKGLDFYLIVSIFLLLVFGLVVIWSTNPSLAQKQILFIFLALPLFFFFSYLDYKTLFRFAPYFLLVTFILLAVTPLLGATVRGTGRWFQIGSLTFQPSEVAKLALILGISWIYALSRFNKLQKFVISLAVAVFYAGLVVVQPDLGTAIILLFIWVLVSFLAGARFIHFLVLFLAGLAFLPVGWQFLATYQRERIFAFLNPKADPLGGGYNVLQAIIAVGSGKLVGRGLGRGPQSQLRFLPERSTDFIFASLAEEWGLLGSGLLLVFFFFLLARILRIGSNANTKFGLLVCMGIFAMLFVQIFINVGMNIGVMPVTGIPLPLISAGGSSLIITLTALGIVQNISGHSNNSF